MIIIQLAGGLGNQMFQYALYLQLKSLGKIVKIDDVSGFAQDRQRAPALAPFGADYERPSRAEMEAMLDSSPLLRNKIRRKLCGRRKKSYFEEDKCYKPEIMEWDDIYLEGYWQTEKYFPDVAKTVKKIFDPDRLSEYMTGKTAPAGRSGTMGDWLERIVSTESVSVHVRRGDYLLPENQKLFGDICTEEYYHIAMKEMRREHPGCVFYLFTNDKEWAREWTAGLEQCMTGGKDGEAADPAEERKPDDTETETGVTAVYGENLRIEIVELDAIPDCGMNRDYAEFVLMSKCRHNILANSSFSWWASYLNANPEKTVLAPDNWLNGWNCEDFYREDMRRVGTKAC